MTTYEQFINGQRPNLKFATDNGKPLVMGWMVVDYGNDGTRKEKIWAVHPDGRIAESEWIDTTHRDNHNFNRPGRKWELDMVVPFNADFIGHYPADMF